jgi:hypothetical protein
MLLASAEVSAVCAAIPAVLALLNLREQTTPERSGAAGIASHVASLRTSVGFTKVAELLATPAGIVPVTLLLAAGQVLPLPLLWLAWRSTTFIIPFLGPPIRIGMAPVWWALAAVALSFLPRMVNAARKRQSWLSVVLHPVDVVLLLGVQWYALLRKLLGKPAA